MEAHDVGKEHLSHRLGSVRVRQRYELAVLAEAVDDGEDHRLPIHPGQRFHKIQVNVGPDNCGNGQRQQQPGWMQVL